MSETMNGPSTPRYDDPPRAARTAASPTRFSAVIAHARTYRNVIYALILHDIKNRFFGSGLGQIAMILWPFVHILVLLTVYVVLKRPNPYGESVIQYSSVSIFPFICFSYVARWIVFSANSNKPFLHYTVIKPLDLVIARTLLEIVSITIVAILLLIFVFACGYDIMPAEPGQAVFAVLATIFLAIGMGIFNAPFGFLTQFWNLVVTLLVIGLYVSSGILFVPSFLPAQLRDILSYNPLLHCIEWMRSAYYSDYPTEVLDKTYVFEWGLTMLTLGLIMLKIFRRFF